MKSPSQAHELFQSLKSSNVTPSKKFEIPLADCGGYGNMNFSQSDFHNMRRDERMMVSQQDVDLVVNKFEPIKQVV